MHVGQGGGSKAASREDESSAAKSNLNTFKIKPSRQLPALPLYCSQGISLWFAPECAAVGSLSRQRVRGAYHFDLLLLSGKTRGMITRCGIEVIITL